MPHRTVLSTSLRTPARVAVAGLLALGLLAPSAPAAAVEPSQAAADRQWEPITFGQSTDLNFASNVLPEKVGTNYAEPEQPGTIEGTTVLESRGGKLAAGHDGLTFYQTSLDPDLHNFVLEADITIEQFGPETGAAPSGQDSAGIMVRDINGAPRQDPLVLGFEEVPAASNIFGVGMMRHGISPIHRTGVVYPWGNPGSTLRASAFTSDSQYTLPTGTPVRVRLERTDTEFVMSTTFTHVAEPATFEQRVAGADWVQDIDPDQMFVGFYAARNALMRVENASLTLSEANTVPREPVVAPPPNASLQLVSAAESASTDYALKALTNYDGTISVVADGTEVVTDTPVTAREVFTHHTTLAQSQTAFSVTFTPTGAPSAEPLTRDITVTRRTFPDAGGLFVSTAGTSDAAGTIEDPLDLATAVRYVPAGGTILMRGGTYPLDSTITISQAYSGEPGQPKTLAAYQGEQVIIDGQDQLSQVMRLDADHWHLFGIELTRATGNGLRMSGSHNVIELMVFSHHQNSGFQMTGGGDDPAGWPSHNLILNCESHDNRDPRDIDADGFAAKLGVGAGNVFRGNIAHHNIDDGWDLYNRTNEGPNLPVLLEGNIAYSNGKLSDGYNEDGNTGTGFKLGGEGLPVEHVIRDNIAFDNNLDGFSDNFNPGRLVLENNTAFDNKRFNFIIRFNPYFSPEEQGVFRNNLSFRADPQDALPDFISGDVDHTNFLFDGARTVNNRGLRVTPRDFASLDPPAGYQRAPAGDIQFGDFLRLARTSPLNVLGTGHGHIGALPGRERRT